MTRAEFRRIAEALEGMRGQLATIASELQRVSVALDELRTALDQARPWKRGDTLRRESGRRGR